MEEVPVDKGVEEVTAKIAMFYIGEDGKKHLTDEHKAKMRAGREAAKQRRLETGEKLTRKSKLTPEHKKKLHDGKEAKINSTRAKKIANGEPVKPRRLRKTTTVEEELYDEEA